MKKLFLNLIVGFLLCYNVIAQAENKLIFSGISGAVNSDISMRVLSEAYKEIGFDVKFLPLPGERALRASNSGETDGEVFRIANVQKRYKNLIPVPTPINVLEGIVFTKNKNIKVNGWNSLKPYRIGIQVGIKFVERGTKGMNRTIVDSNEQLFRMLNAGRIDIAVVAYTNGVKAIKKLGVDGIKANKPAVQVYPLYHYLNTKHSSLVNKLDAVLKKMQSTGRIKEIREMIISDISRK